MKERSLLISEYVNDHSRDVVMYYIKGSVRNEFGLWYKVNHEAIMLTLIDSCQDLGREVGMIVSRKSV